MEDKTTNRRDDDKTVRNADDFPGYPTYPASEDIYNQLEQEEDIDPEDISQKKVPVENGTDGKANIKDFYEDVTGGDLDIPGSDDDQQEEIGSEDEENNSYSIGGDNHEGSEENQGDDYSSSRI